MLQMLGLPVISVAHVAWKVLEHCSHDLLQAESERISRPENQRPKSQRRAMMRPIDLVPQLLQVRCCDREVCLWVTTEEGPWQCPPPASPKTHAALFYSQGTENFPSLPQVMLVLRS